MRAFIAVVAVSFVAMSVGCSSVRMTQRDGCWIRETEKFPKQVTEEVGPCARAEPKWAEDRITRIVQECVAHEDYRWQARAVAAWSNRQPVPEQEDEGEILDACMNQAANTMVSENEALKKRLQEVDEDRATYKRIAEEDRRYFRDHNARIATALGEAAKKPAPTAIATATSSGTASTNAQNSARPSSTSTTHTAPSPSIPGPALTSMQTGPKTAAKNAAESKMVDRARPLTTSNAAKAPECEVKPAVPVAPTSVKTSNPVAKPIPAAPVTTGSK